MSDALAEVRGVGTVSDLRRLAEGVGMTVLPNNAHVHLPPNCSAFRTVREAVDLAAAKNCRILGASNYYDYQVYSDFAGRGGFCGTRDAQCCPSSTIFLFAADHPVNPLPVPAHRHGSFWAPSPSRTTCKARSCSTLQSLAGKSRSPGPPSAGTRGCLAWPVANNSTVSLVEVSQSTVVR